MAISLTTFDNNNNSIAPTYAARLNQESAKAFAAFCFYRDMGVNRSLDKVSQKHGKNLATLTKWSKTYGWVARAEAFDAHIQEIELATREEEIAKILRNGYANMHKRVETLNELAQALEREIFNGEKSQEPRAINRDNLYIEESKEFGTATEFNKGLLSEFRATLDDIAAETGGRIKPKEATNVNVAIGIKTIAGVDLDRV